MHILLIHQAFAALDEAGGTRHHELVRYLAGQGHRITVIASPVSYLTGARKPGKFQWIERQEDGPQIVILRPYTYSGLHRSFVHRVFSFLSFMVSSLVTGLSVRSVDLVWGTSPPIFQGITAWLLARLKGALFLFEVRDLWPAFAIEVGVLHNPLLVKSSLWLERFLYRRADRVMVNSPGYIDHVRQKGARRVELIPNGADPAMFDPQSDGAAFRQAHQLGQRFVVLYAGAHGMSNDLDLVLDAARQIRDADPQIVFLMLGDGKEKLRLVERAAREGLSNVVFLPPVPKLDMAQALAAADACIAILKPIPLYKTTYPNKVFDYMAAGRPVVLAIDGVIREVVEAAGGGVAVPPGDAQALAAAVRGLAARPDRGREMGAAGRRYVEEHFSRADLAQRLSLLVDEMRRMNG